jgi:hypothetical protein
MMIGRWENGIGQALVFWSHSPMATKLTVAAIGVEGERDYEVMYQGWFAVLLSTQAFIPWASR